MDSVKLADLLKYYNPSVPRHRKTLQLLQESIDPDYLIQARSQVHEAKKDDPINLESLALDYDDSLSEIITNLGKTLSPDLLKQLTAVWRDSPITTYSVPKPKPRGKIINVPGIGKVGLLDPIIPNGHFNWAEATKGGQRIPVNGKHTNNIKYVAKKLEWVRSFFGDRPITITSWYRPEPYNSRVGGSSRSKHLQGHAVDIIVPGLSYWDTYSKLKPLWQEGGLGNGENANFGAHLDCRKSLEGQGLARWSYRGGRY